MDLLRLAKLAVDLDLGIREKEIGGSSVREYNEKDPRKALDNILSPDTEDRPLFKPDRQELRKKILEDKKMESDIKGGATSGLEGLKTAAEDFFAKGMQLADDEIEALKKEAVGLGEEIKVNTKNYLKGGARRAFDTMALTKAPGALKGGRAYGGISAAIEAPRAIKEIGGALKGTFKPKAGITAFKNF